MTKEGADKDLILGVLSRLQKNADYLNATVIRHVRDRGRVLYAMERVLESAQKARYAKIGPLFFDRNLKVEGVAKAITQFVQEQREAFQGINKDFHLKNSLALKESSLSQQRFLEYEMQTSIENFVDLSQASYSGKSKMQLKMELRKISVALGDLLKAVKALRKSYRQQFAAQQREAHKEILNYLIQEHPKVLRIMGKSPELYIYSF